LILKLLSCTYQPLLRMRPVFCIVSIGRGRGKTALIEWLLEKLSKKGISAATVKHSKEDPDISGKDTWRHLEAGAVEVVYTSPRVVATIRRSPSSLEEALREFHVEPDVILVEGFKDSPYPKILCARGVMEIEEAFKSIENIAAVILESDSTPPPAEARLRIASREEVLQMIERAVRRYWISMIPGFDCRRCLQGSCAALAEAIESGLASIRDCVMRSHAAARIIIDGVEIPLGPWPQRLLKELVKAFVNSLKVSGVDVERASRLIVNIKLADRGRMSIPL